MIRAAAGSQLAQARPSNTSAGVAYTAPLDLRVEVTRVVICNTTGSPVAASLFHDDDGTSFDQSTALLFAKPVPANDAIELSFDLGAGLFLSQGAALGVRSATASALTFSFYGVIESRGA